jgi:hypothetical protein
MQRQHIRKDGISAKTAHPQRVISTKTASPQRQYIRKDSTSAKTAWPLAPFLLLHFLGNFLHPPHSPDLFAD